MRIARQATNTSLDILRSSADAAVAAPTPGRDDLTITLDAPNPYRGEYRAQVRRALYGVGYACAAAAGLFYDVPLLVLGAAAAAALCFIGAFGVTETERETTWDKMHPTLKAGIESVHAGRYEDARTELARVLQEAEGVTYVSHSEIFSVVGALAEQAGEPHVAEQYYSRWVTFANGAMDHHGNYFTNYNLEADVKAHLARARARIKRGILDLALEDLLHVMKKDSNGALGLRAEAQALIPLASEIPGGDKTRLTPKFTFGGRTVTLAETPATDK